MTLPLELPLEPEPGSGAMVFTVFGTARPAGSKRAFVRGKRAHVVDANPNAKPWKLQVAQVAGEAMQDADLFEGPLSVGFIFYVARPKGHYTSKGELSAKGRRTPYPAKKPDVLKLARAVEDALSGVVYRDDAQIVEEYLSKRWGTPERVEIAVQALS